MATLFVAGASGYTGRALVSTACRAGHDVVAHLRPGSASADACVPRFEAAGARVDRTPWQAGAMAATLARVQPQVVFGLLGTTRERGRAARIAGGAEESYQTVDRDLTLLLLHAAEACGSEPRFVFLSSLGADTPRGNAYLQARFEVEAALRASAVPWTIARPSIITGPDRPEPRFAEHLAGRAADLGLGLVAALGARTLRDRYAAMDAETLAAGLLAVALDPAAERQIVDAAWLRAGRPAT